MRRLGLLAVWLLLAVPLWVVLFLHSQTSMVIASHDAVVRPTLDRYVRLSTGPYLPDLRMPSGSRLGVRVDVGKTRAADTDELIQRYALIANRPDAEVRAVADELKGMAVDAGLRAAVLAAIPIGLWLLLGERRRAELLRPSVRTGAVVVAAGGLGVLAVVQPWRPDPPRVQTTSWIGLPAAVPELTVPADLQDVEVQGGLITDGTRKLIASAFASYDHSKTFYESLKAKAPSVAAKLHVPEDGQSVAVLVSDRHDNVGMDPVVRAVADLGGATAVIDAGDDTSTGETWETFSLDSLVDTFSGYDAHIAVSGNHDHGKFVSGYLSRRGWTHLDHEVATPFAGARFFGVDDPRSSGLGAYRDIRGASFDEVRDRLTQEVCDLDKQGNRVATLVVHDANLAKDAVAQGCTDLVVAGHLHVQVGPDRVVGSNGKVGYSYTNGTTGGAAYALAIGSKLRREAEFTLVTYAAGRPVGIQPVRVTTRGEIVVEAYIALDLGE